MMLSPGLSFLFAILPRAFFLPIITCVALTLSSWHISIWKTISLVVLSFALQHLAIEAIHVLAEALTLKRLNAQIVPRLVIKSGWAKPGGLDFLTALFEEEREGYLGNLFTDAVSRLGHIFRLIMLGESRINICNPAYIKRVLATEFENFEKGSPFSNAVHSVLGTGVFNSDDELWKFHRAMTRPFFSRERISDFNLLVRHADAAIDRLKARLKQGEAVDFQDLASRFTLDSASEFLFGACVNSLSNTLPYPHNSQKAKSDGNVVSSEVFSRAFAKAQLTITLRLGVGRIWPLLEFWRDQTKSDMKIISGFIEPIVREALQKKKSLSSDTASKPAEDTDVSTSFVREGDTLLDHLVRCTDDSVIIRDEALNILIAGRDTTAALITYTVYMLAMHPKIFRKLREEVLNHVGATATPTYEYIRDMRYLRAVINEVLRLYPPVPFNVRNSKEDTVWPSLTPEEKPYYIPARTRIIYSPFVMQRCKDFWGPDALVFDPDRFIDERLSKYLTPNPFIFLPFNAGPRICLGQQFAYNEASIFLIRFLQSFSSVTLDKNAQPPDSIPPLRWKDAKGRESVEGLIPKTHLTMYIKGGLWVRMEEASETQVS